MKNFKPTIMIDLDGVLNTYTGDYKENYIPTIKEGADKFLIELSYKYTIKIFTTRNRLLVSKWLIENKLDSYVLDVTNIKDVAYLYIDDRCICFSGNFHETLDKIENFSTYWKK